MFRAGSIGPFDKATIVAMGHATYDSLFCSNELDLFDRVGWWASSERDLASEPSSRLGNAGCSHVYG